MNVALNIFGWIVILGYTLALTFIFCYSIMQFHLVSVYLRKKWQLWKAKREGEESEDPHADVLPFVTVQLPTFNELYVVDRLIDAVCAFDYPKDRYEIQMLDDSNDETTGIIQKKVDHYKAQGIDIQLVRRPERVGFKAGALKYGLDHAKGKYVAIFDADFLPKKDFLSKTVPHLEADDGLGVVQTRWGHLNKKYSMITRMQAFGLDAHFTIEQVGRNSAGHFINFNGTAGIWRAKTIIDAGNWQPDTLTEDLDLSYRAQLKGWKFKYLEEFESPAELPATMPAVKSQQFRWNKGGAESAVKNMKSLWKSEYPLGTKIHGIFHLLNSAVFLGIFIMGILSIPVLLVKDITYGVGPIFALAKVFLFSFFSLSVYYSIAYFRLEKFSVLNLITFILFFPLFLSVSMGLSLHNAIAVIEGYIGKKTPFIRTPKFNITDKKDSWKKNVYLNRKINPLTFLEGLLSLYFLAGLLIGIFNHDYGMTLLHSMLFVGYTFVFFYSVKHARFA